ncbi:Protein SYM1, putative [Perkinsus marinus ATCC 50983]|uniref:Protein SYM1, putative n=1 Tax=Perkinsus marinus (strain ATCC 50983 / TXsc) TaxID=423536 RepID=C5LMR6_PERM5|nr:Protein SYM1, putative [Perkinsus marinus ATCC 50983]EER01957.1 Protein SYM1, putative [Perkinsus marinus ATCC 50983]|eukprot:XP_002769239.1 Protein SYM1, putative [Perkinsus marinus ATCC 50983]
MVASAVARVYRRSPILANSISSVFFFALSDWFAQKAEKASDHIDKKRVAAVAMCGPIFNGLPLTLFYEAMDKHIGTKATFRVVGRKLLAMQFIYMPISVPSFLFLSTLFHRLLLGEEVSRSVYRAKEAATSKWAEAYLASWFVWPVSDTFNFTVVQKILPAARPTWDCVVDVGWNAYLSWRGIGGHSITEFAAARP